MEATFLNFCDENFTTLSHFCQKDEPDDPDSGLLDLIHDDFSYQASNFGVAMDLWETEQDSNSDSSVLPVTIPQEGSLSRIDHSNKEDFQKMLLDWQEHLGSLQVSDTEEIDAVPEQLPDNIFEDHIYDSMFTEKPIFTSVTSKSTPSISIKDDDINIYNLDELLDCADDNDDKLPIKIHEHVLRKMGQFKVDPVAKPEIKAAVKSESEIREAGGEQSIDKNNQRKSVKLESRISVKNESYADCKFMKINNVNEQLATAEFAKGASTLSEQNDSFELLDCDPLKMEEELLKTFPKIKVEPSELDLKLEVDEDCVDIETVSEQIPVLEAGDLKSLLEQFEASEAVSPNIATGTATSLQQQMAADSALGREKADTPATAATSAPSTSIVSAPIKPPITLPSSGQQTLPNVTTSVTTSVVSTLTTHTPAPHATSAIPSCLKISNSATRPLLKSLHLSQSVSAVSVAANQCPKESKLFDNSSPSTSVASSGSSSPVSQPTTPPQSNHKIQESLSAALIEKLKASGRKKTIPVIPAMPTKRSGRGATRMQDAGAALSRNKLLKIVAGGESIQLDHDYCSMSSGTVEAPRPFYHSDASEYSVAPNASLLLPQEQQLKHSSSTDCWENSSRKDSGLESGDVSDASEEAGGSSVVTSVDCGSGTVITTLKSSVTSAQIQPGTSLLRKSLNTGPHVANNTNSQKQKLKQFQQQQRQQQQNQQISQQPQQQNFQKQQQQQQQHHHHHHLKEQQSPSAQTQQAPKKRKLNLEEYRNRLKDRDRAKDTPMGNSKIISVADIPMPPSNTAAEVNKKSTDNVESRVRPEMCNAEVQADVSKEMGATSDTEKRLGRLRDHRHRQYRSKRHSSSSSSSSESSQSSSSSSRSSSYSPSRKQRRQRNRSRHRRRSRSRRRTSSKRRHSSASRSCSRSSSSRSSRGGSSSRSRSPFRGPRCRNISQISDREKQRQVEERRVIYVGRIDEGTSKAQLRKRFEVFGPIIDISVHFREHGDNYGFVTYMYKKDAYEAVEHGNDDPHLPQYDLCFGGRRAFCKTRYADLDGLATSNDSVGQFPARGPSVKSRQEDSFDLLLREAQATIRKRSKV
ncbi:peroxisome proliferator-activated receptor gamma coactivator 1-alpha isoform X3 [Schistocerca gregaria]|uniref:peroxisome proliferator-activated receptor gamma coactivator 1-alpha isoform X3 n=1 Tax=Schistocerca gregaria TaxID=7010 RepID=UPI00211E6B54|nr:peroxisome proliferator-activated receptor gamma coactivator 1-alpha isoform X3 [Schistocerca gregaria]XP_049860152.1 peroxisome proliferator-activated receptor gamma coactivator 1-alpha isoform X3 [Schistocerca gregaria]